MTIASPDPDYAQRLASGLQANFRAYTSTDVVGVEVGGATKNVLAIGAGICDGLGFGANTRVALITRGLAEMMRLGVALGGRKETFMGLAGTRRSRAHLHRRPVAQPPLRAGAGGRQDRRRRRAEIGQVVEGVLAARAVCAVAANHGVEMPIAEQIHRVIYAGLSPREAVAALMGRASSPRRSSGRHHPSCARRRPWQRTQVPLQFLFHGSGSGCRVPVSVAQPVNVTTLAVL